MQRFKNILYVCDPKEDAPCGLERAVGLAESNQAQLTIAAVGERLPTRLDLAETGLVVEALQDAVIDALQRRLDGFVGSARKGIAIRPRALTGTLFLEVIREVLRNRHDLVMKCVEGVSSSGGLFGSQDMHLLRKCPCPVWLDRAVPTGRYRCIVAAVDVDPFAAPHELESRRELNLRLLETAASLASAELAELHIAHVWNAAGEGLMRGGLVSMSAAEIDAYVASERARRTEALAALVDEAGRRIGKGALDWLRPTLHLEKGTPADELPALTGRLGADLLVLGTVGRSGIPGLLIGNTAESVLQRITCAVLALKPQGFVTPVTLPD